jgi:hypothetical protein
MQIVMVSDGVPNGFDIPGRIFSKRASGQSLIFYDIRGDGVKVQVRKTAQFGL